MTQADTRAAELREQLLARGGFHATTSRKSLRWAEASRSRNPKRDQHKSKATSLRSSEILRDGAAAIQSKGEKGMTTEVFISLSRNRAFST